MFQASNFKEKGFTLTELLVSILIIAILSAIALANYRTGQEKLILERAATKLAQDIRKAQEMAMSAQEFKGQVPGGGYGIYLDKVPSPQTSYVLFADIGDTPNGKYDPGSENIETINFEAGVKIKEFIGNHFNIIFKPPDPTVIFKDNEGNELGLIVSITICSKQNETKTKTITVNKAGLIDVVD